jgi:AcrR family transcriptional regulator
MTRERLFEAAVTEFSEHGYEGASVRQICQRAKANPAAIKYYFASKEGLYREVLRAASHAFSAQVLVDEAKIEEIDGEDAVRLLIREQLMPLLRRDKIGRYLRLFAWENMAPTAPFRQFLASERIPIMSLAGAVARKFAPATASQEEILVTTIWLLNLAAPFIRSHELLARPPFNLRIDEPFIVRLTEQLVGLALAGLTRFSASAITAVMPPVMGMKSPLAETAETMRAGF